MCRTIPTSPKGCGCRLSMSCFPLCSWSATQCQLVEISGTLLDGPSNLQCAVALIFLSKPEHTHTYTEIERERERERARETHTHAHTFTHTHTHTHTHTQALSLTLSISVHLWGFGDLRTRAHVHTHTRTNEPTAGSTLAAVL